MMFLILLHAFACSSAVCEIWGAECSGSTSGSLEVSTVAYVMCGLCWKTSTNHCCRQWDKKSTSMQSDSHTSSHPNTTPHVLERNFSSTRILIYTFDRGFDRCIPRQMFSQSQWLEYDVPHWPKYAAAVRKALESRPQKEKLFQNRMVILPRRIQVNKEPSPNTHRFDTFRYI